MPKRHCICEVHQAIRQLCPSTKDAETQLPGEVAIINEMAGRYHLKNIPPQCTEPDRSSRPRSQSRRRNGCTRIRGQPMIPDGRPIPGTLIPWRPGAPRRAPKNVPESDPIRSRWNASSDDEPPQPRPKRQQSPQFRPEGPLAGQHPRKQGVGAVLRARSAE